jgi:Peptidase family M48
MHLVMLILTLGWIWCIRWTRRLPHKSWTDRWQRALSLFLFPPLLLLTTSIAIVLMGPRGEMVYPGEGWLSYGFAVSFLSFAAIMGFKLLWEGLQLLKHVRRYPPLTVNGRPGRLLSLSTPYSAQVGFYQPELVISQGLLDTLDPAHLEAVLTHEQGHAYFRDTFWFFWLGWIRQITTWLPQTENLWQELLILRELRADHWAAQQVDRLLLAEALLTVVSAPLIQPEGLCAPFSYPIQNRLTERIEALLTPEQPEPPSRWTWSGLLFTLIPLFSVPFHT